MSDKTKAAGQAINSLEFPATAQSPLAKRCRALVCHFSITGRALSGLTLCVFLSLSVTSVSASTYLDRPEVSLWVEQTVAETSLDRDYVRSQLSLASRLDKVIERISRPAEKTLNWGEYRKIFIQPRRIESGRAFLAEHKALLQQAEEKYGVPAEIITAIIGVETFYGQHKGKDEALSSLATLAFDYPPRAKFFKRELQEFLLLAREEGFEPASIRGSYAAAMGMPQFISSSYRHYAVDFDGDGQRDLWNSVADVIGSVANYLNVHGWVTGGSVAERVEPSGDGYRNLLSKKLKPALRRKQLRQAGIITSVRSENEKTLMELQKGDNREVWVGFQNFFVITRYNHSRLYAMAVYELSNALGS